MTTTLARTTARFHDALVPIVEHRAATQLRDLLALARTDGLTLVGFDLTDRVVRETALALIARSAALSIEGLTESQLTTRWGMNADPIARSRIAQFQDVLDHTNATLRWCVGCLGTERVIQLVTAWQREGR